MRCIKIVDTISDMLVFGSYDFPEVHIKVKIETFLKKAHGGTVCRNHPVIVVQCEDAVGNALVDAFQIVLHIQRHFIELGIFQRHGYLRRKGSQKLFILTIKYACFFVYYLCDADGFTLPVNDRRTDDTSGLEPGFFINGRVKQGVLIGIFNIQNLTGGDGMTG